MRIFLLLLVFAAFVPAQSKPVPCTTTYAHAPSLRGLRLGMSAAEVNAILKPAIPLKAVAGKVQISFMDLPKGPDFEGVMWINIKFGTPTIASKNMVLDDIEIVYGDLWVKWKTVSELLDNVSPKLGIDRNAFIIEPVLTFRAYTRCRGFAVFVDQTSPSIRLMATTLLDNASRVEKKKKAAFKP